MSHRHVFNPPYWCGAASTALCGDVETLSVMEKLLSGKRDQGDRSNLMASLCGKSKCPRNRLDYREAILLVSASTTWSRSGLVPSRTTG